MVEGFFRMFWSLVEASLALNCLPSFLCWVLELVYSSLSDLAALEFGPNCSVIFFSFLDVLRSLLAESLTCRGILRDFELGRVANEMVLLVNDAQEVKMLLVDSSRSDTEVLVGEDSQRFWRRER